MRGIITLAVLVGGLAMTQPVAAQSANARACDDPAPERAIQGCSEIIEAGGERGMPLFQAHFNRGLAYAQRNRHIDAIADYDAALKIRRKDPAVLQSRCWSRSVAGRLTQAIEDCNAALALRPDDPDTLEIRGFTWRKMREFEKSLADYDAALALRPQQADTLFGRGVTLYDMGVREEAQADFAAARSLQPDIADHYARIGIRRAFDSYGSITRTGEPSSQALTASTVSP